MQGGRRCETAVARAGALGVVLALVSCNAILGLDPVQKAPEDAGGGAGGGAPSAGGTGGLGATGGAGTGGAGTGGAGTGGAGAAIGGNNGSCGLDLLRNGT